MNFVISDNLGTLKFDNFSHFLNDINYAPTCKRRYNALRIKTFIWSPKWIAFDSVAFGYVIQNSDKNI